MYYTFNRYILQQIRTNCLLITVDKTFIYFLTKGAEECFYIPLKIKCFLSTDCTSKFRVWAYKSLLIEY